MGKIYRVYRRVWIVKVRCRCVHNYFNFIYLEKIQRLKHVLQLILTFVTDVYVEKSNIYYSTKGVFFNLSKNTSNREDVSCHLN